MIIIIQNTKMKSDIRSYPLPLFFGVLNSSARPYVPRFTKDQMDRVFQIQEEELSYDDSEEEEEEASDDDE